MTFTPRPWMQSSTISSIVIAPDEDCTREETHYFGGKLIARDVAEKNRPLIEAAPDLYALLVRIESKAALHFDEDYAFSPDWLWVREICRAAIAKADGRE